MNDTEKKHFSSFKIPLALLAGQANALGRTALITLYAAALWLMALLRHRFEFTDVEVKQAEDLAAEVPRDI